MGTFEWVLEEFWQIAGGLAVAVVAALASYIALRVRKLLERREQGLIKRQAVEDCVKAVEQVYGELPGSVRKEKAQQGVRELLQAQKIEITDFELDILIEACVKELNCGLFSAGKRPGDTFKKK